MRIAVGEADCGRTTSSSGITLAGEKKCSPITSAGRSVDAAISSTSSVDVLDASSAPGFATFVELREHLLLEAHVFEHGLDDHVAAGEIFVTQRRRDEREPARLLRGVDAAAFHHALEGGVDRRDALVESGLVRIQQRHGDAGIRERDRDAAAHGARADDTGTLERVCLAWRQTVDLAALAFGKEYVDGTPRLDGSFRPVGVFLFFEQALLDGHRARDHRLERRERGAAIRIHPFRLVVPPGLEGLCDLEGVHLPFGGAAWTAVRGDQPLRVRERTGQQVACNDFIDEAELERFDRIDRLGIEDHAQRIVEPDEPRQPLRAARARDDAQRDFGQHEFRRRRCNAIVAGQREFEPSADRRTVQRGDHGNFHALELRPQLAVLGFLGRAGKLVDVRAGEEIVAFTAQDERARGFIGGRMDQRLRHARACGGRDGIDGRVVHHEDEKVAVALQLNDGSIHLMSVSLLKSRSS